MSKWTIVAYPDEKSWSVLKRKEKVVEAKDHDEAIRIAWMEFPEYHEVGAFKEENSNDIV